MSQESTVIVQPRKTPYGSNGLIPKSTGETTKQDNKDSRADGENLCGAPRISGAREPDETGNSDSPSKLKLITQEPPTAVATSAHKSARSKYRPIAAAVLLAIVLALGFGFWVVSQRVASKSIKVSSRTSPSSLAPAEIGKPLDLPALAQKARGAVVLILGNDARGHMSSGSGFFISADARLVTNNHVVQAMVNAQAKLESGAIYNITGILASSSELDLAVLKADAQDTQFLVVNDAPNPPQSGTRIAVIGSPLALEGSLSEGIVSGIRSIPDGSLLVQISAPISPGSSGSPVLDRDGKVVGVATMAAMEGQNLNFARSAHDLRNFLLTVDEDTEPKALSEKEDEVLSDPRFVAAKDANDRGDGAVALKFLNTLVQRYRCDARLLFQIAWAYESLGLHEEAYRSWRTYIDVDPTDAVAWRHFAIAAGNLKRIDEAVNAYRQALKIGPDAVTWQLLGNLYDAQGQHALAVYAHGEAKRLKNEAKLTDASSTAGASTAGRELPQKTTPESPNGEAQTTEDTEVGQLFEKWLTASNAGDTEQEASLYTEPADYLEFATLSRHDLVQELQRDRQRWPKQHFTVSRKPVVEKLRESEWRVTFTINFDVQNPSRGRQVTGTADLTWLVRRRDSGELEIASSKEQVRSRTSHDRTIRRTTKHRIAPQPTPQPRRDWRKSLR